MSNGSAIYVGQVVHRRHRPKPHALRYRVFSLLIDLDDLPRLDELRWFSHNGAAVFSFWDSDHADGGDLRRWAADQLHHHGLPAPGRIRLLCYPRVLGYVFNPLTVWYCDGPDGRSLARIYEVHNTVGQRHAYVLTDDAGRQSTEKTFYVSPFIDMDCRYNFRLSPPAETILVSIDETQNDAPLLYAAFTGKRRDFTEATLRRLFFTHPLMTLKVTAGIYWEAFRLLLKGIKVR